MRKKKYIIVLDVEGTRHAFVYDIGFAVIDLHGNIYKTFSAMVIETFFSMREEMYTAYYADKIPEYGARLKNDETNMLDIDTIRRIIFSTMEEYEIDTIAAYNVRYDKSALDRTIAEVTEGFVTEFFPTNTTFWDIWGMACETILNTKKYKAKAKSNEWVSEKGNIKTSAECAYRYLIDNDEFEEEHNGLADVLIEACILWATIATRKKMTRTPISCPWKIVQET